MSAPPFGAVWDRQQPGSTHALGDPFPDILARHPDHDPDALYFLFTPIFGSPGNASIPPSPPGYPQPPLGPPSPLGLTKKPERGLAEIPTGSPIPGRPSHTSHHFPVHKVSHRCQSLSLGGGDLAEIPISSFRPIPHLHFPVHTMSCVHQSLS